MARILRFPELRSLKGIDYSRVHIDRLEKAGKFPKRLHLGENSVGWLEDEIDAWIAGKAAARDAEARSGSLLPSCPNAVLP